jgi:hypothetical protein
MHITVRWTETVSWTELEGGTAVGWTVHGAGRVNATVLKQGRGDVLHKSQTGASLDARQQVEGTAGERQVLFLLLALLLAAFVGHVRGQGT